MGLVWFIGSFAILFESKSRRVEISVFTIWRLATGLIHIMTNVKGDEEHSKEFNVWFSSIIFAMASAFGGYCLSRDSSKLRSLDRGILLTLFPKELNSI